NSSAAWSCSRLAEDMMSMPLLYRGGQLFGTRDSTPLSDQFAISSEHENAKIRCSLRLAKLRRHRSIKIGRNENVFPRITCNLLSFVSGLKPFCFFVHPVPDQCGRDPLPNHGMSSRKTNNCDHPVIRVAQAMFRNAIPHGVCLFSVCRGGQHDYSHMSVSCRMFVSININKTERVGCSDGKGSMQTRYGKQN